MVPMQQWRERILQRTLRTSSILASIAYIPSTIAAYNDGIWILILVSTLVVGLLLVITFWGSLDSRIRTWAFIGTWYLFAVFLVWLLGPMGAGAIWLLAVPILGALFFGHGGAWTGSLLVLLFSLIYLLLPASSLMGDIDALSQRYTIGSWFAVAGSLLFLSCLVSLAIAELLTGLAQSMTELEATNASLAVSLLDLEALQNELLVNQKQYALGSLASGIAHDFNNLLVPILIAGEEARDHTTEGSDQRRHLDTIIKSAERARELIRRILRFSQNIEVERQDIALAPVLDEVVSLLRSAAGPEVRVDCDNEAAAAQVSGDAEGLHQIIMNLGANALLALPERNPTLSLRVRRNSEQRSIDITVSDNGCGIPESIRDRIFDPYFSTRSAGTGTGLGLAIVHRLVTRLHGTIRFESNPAGGTDFTVSLPDAGDTIMAPTDSVHGREATESRDSGHQRLRILIVDDEEMVRSTLSAILQRDQHLITMSEMPEEALRLVHDGPQNFDVVITDHAMPGMTGLELSRQLRHIRPDLHIILVSGYLTEQDLRDADALGISGVLDKPFRRQQILDLLWKVQGRPETSQ